MLRVWDYPKAVIAATVILAANVAISYVVVAIYAYLIEPGREAEFYEAAAQLIAPWSSVVGGAFLFFGAAFVLAKRRPERKAIAMAVAIFSAYAIVEFIVMSSAGKLMEMIAIVSLSLATKLAAAILGARSASVSRRAR